LEDALGFQLFDRHKQPIQPTPMGEGFIARSREIMLQVNDLAAWVNREQEVLEGTYRIGIIPTLAPYVLPRILPDLATSAPGVDLVLSEVTSERMLEQLKSGALDAGILVTPVDEPAIREIPIYTEPFMIFGHPTSDPDAPRSGWLPEDLPIERLLLLEEGHCFRDQMLALCNRNRPSASGLRYESGSIASLQALVRVGMGYTLIPALAADLERDADLLRTFADPQPVREVSLVAHHSYPRERFLNWLRDHVRERMPAGYRKGSKTRRVRWRM
jgi:LysR family hydrogen peroxide-inducible transcriptional activator